MRTLNIGNKDLMYLNDSELFDLISIEGYLYSTENLQKPIIKSKDVKKCGRLFKSEIVFKIEQKSKNAGVETKNYTIIFDCLNLQMAMKQQFNMNIKVKPICLQSINYLLNNGYDIPMLVNEKQIKREQKNEFI